MIADGMTDDSISAGGMVADGISKSFYDFIYIYIYIYIHIYTYVYVYHVFDI